YSAEVLMVDVLECRVLEVSLAQVKIMLLNLQPQMVDNRGLGRSIDIAGSAEDPRHGSEVADQTDRSQPFMGEPSTVPDQHQEKMMHHTKSWKRSTIPKQNIQVPIWCFI